MALWLLLVVVLFLMNQGLAEAAYYHCYSRDNLTSGSEDGYNRNSFLAALNTDVPTNGGYFVTQSETYTSSLSFIGLCRADQIASSDSACSICIKNCTSVIMSKCPVQREAIAWGEDAGCIVRCAPHEFRDMDETLPVPEHSCNASNVLVKYLPQFGHALANITRSIAKTAGASINFFSSGGLYAPKYFATEELKVGDSGLTIYVLGLCLPTLSQSTCTACLLAAANESEKLCNGKQGATVFRPSCIFRYELYRFYVPILLPSSPPPPFLNPVSSPPKGIEEDKYTKEILTAVGIPMILIVLTVTVLVTCTITKVLKKRKQNMEDEDGKENAELCVEFRLKTIRVATNDFAAENKLGQGGFGTVYMGTLPNGQQVAVKRLTVHSARGEGEFKNEVQLVARLQHRNLIRLVGFSLQGKERILIYELALNGSLDRFLFDPIKREHLNWEIRYSIIEGIAHGMLYLHEESRLRIIHRDLKASNILLDESMTPKISDFGTARLFVEEQDSASRIVGTYGYMAPEYVKHGKISVKLDVFSFGVLLLEIVCGTKNSASQNRKHVEHLLSKAWKCFITGEVLKLIDPVLLRTSGQTQTDEDEITRCMHIGLLCVQEDATCRPTMNSVILMLDGSSQRLPPPLKPAYYMLIENDDKPNVRMMQQEQDLSVSTEPADSAQQTNVLSFSSTGFSSVNQVSITQPYPEPR